MQILGDLVIERTVMLAAAAEQRWDKAEEERGGGGKIVAKHRRASRITADEVGIQGQPRRLW